MTGIRRSLVALAALILIGCGPGADQFVDVQTAAARQARGELLLDVREADDYKEFHAPNSMNIPFGYLKGRLAELAPYQAKPVMVIDHGGLRASRAWEQLQKAGFTQVTVVQGGMAAWRDEGLPLATLAKQLEEERQQEALVQEEIDQLERELAELKKE